MCRRPNWKWYRPHVQLMRDALPLDVPVDVEAGHGRTGLSAEGSLTICHLEGENGEDSGLEIL